MFPERPSVRSFRSPFELTSTAMIGVAIATALLAIALYLSDVGIVNW